MASSEPQYGIDASFVTEVHAYLKCTVCQLVLRNPVQISTCGHKYCKPCFNRLRNFSDDTNNQFVCPVDRMVVDMSSVFEDKSTSMAIGGLSVKCSANDVGCSWVGELSNLSLHENECEHKVNNVDDEAVEMHGLLRLLRGFEERLNRYENVLQDKEKDIAQLKYSVREMEAKCDRETERNKVLEEKLMLSKKDVKQWELRLENLTLKNIMLEQKVDGLEKGMKEVEQNKLQQEKEMVALKSNVGKLRNNCTDIPDMGDETETVQQHSSDIALLKEAVETVKQHSSDIALLKEAAETVKQHSLDIPLLKKAAETVKQHSSDIPLLKKAAETVKQHSKDIPLLKKAAETVKQHSKDIALSKKLSEETKTTQHHTVAELEEIKESIKLRDETERGKKLYIEVLSVDHSSGIKGQYFNFMRTSIPGFTVGGTLYFKASNPSTGLTGEVVVWGSPNGGSVGDAHGRFNNKPVGPGPGQWKTGDTLVCTLV